jgi:uncharacterized membrane protein
MQMIDLTRLFTLFDFGAVAFILAAWFAIGLRIENATAKKPSVSVLMKAYRREWMKEFITRQPRIFDANILGNLRQGTTFFASSAMITIGGGVALIGNVDRLTALASDLNLGGSPALVWDIKIAFVLLFITNAFLKFVWAHRLFGYCSIIMAAVPNEADNPTALPRAMKAAEINIIGARSFNRGLRSIYFAITALFWLVSPTALIIASCLTVFIIWRREFNSHSRTVLLQSDGKPE